MPLESTVFFYICTYLTLKCSCVVAAKFSGLTMAVHEHNVKFAACRFLFIVE